MTIIFNLSIYIATLTQLVKIVSTRKKKKPFSRTAALKKSPQAKGVVNKVTIMTPKKPNSAIRHVAKIRLNNTKRVTARLPGVGYLCSKYNRVLIRGGRANDLPGVGYTVIRGVFDFVGLFSKKRKRSKYGASILPEYRKHTRRCFRNLN